MGQSVIEACSSNRSCTPSSSQSPWWWSSWPSAPASGSPRPFFSPELFTERMRRGNSPCRSSCPEPLDCSEMQPFNFALPLLSADRQCISDNKNHSNTPAQTIQLVGFGHFLLHLNCSYNIYQKLYQVSG